MKKPKSKVVPFPGTAGNYLTVTMNDLDRLEEAAYMAGWSAGFKVSRRRAVGRVLMIGAACGGIIATAIATIF